MKNKLFILFLIGILLISFIGAEVQTLGVFKQNDCVNLVQTCANCTYNKISSVNDPDSNIVLGLTDMTKDGTMYNYSFCSTNETGQYIVNGYGDPDEELTVWAYDFEVTPNGERASIGSAVFYIGLLIILMIFLIGCVVLFMENENLLSKVGFLGLGYLLLIAITFVAWNMASDFLTSSAFLVEMFRILFFVLMIGLFPLLIGAFAWYLIMITKIKEIERLMTKGFSSDEARRRVK